MPPLKPIMSKDIAKFFLRFFRQQVVLSLKHWGVICLLVLFLVFGVLFYGYIDSFKQIYIKSLKGLYPQAYVVARQDRVKKWMPGISVEKEIFQISQDLRFRFKPNTEDILLVDAGIRASDPSRLSLILNKEPSNSPGKTAWVNQCLWRKLAGSSGFDGEGIYLKARGQRYEYVEIEKFNLLGQRDKDWLVLSKSMARKLGMLFNIAAIYPEAEIDMKTVESSYAAHGYKVFQWAERLPFFNIATYRTGIQLYAVFMLSTVFLIVFLLLSVFHDMLIEFKKVMQFSMIYGLSEFVVFLVFSLFSAVYAIGCHVLAGIVLSVVKVFGVGVLPLIDSVAVYTLTFYSATILLPGLILLNIVALKRVYNEGYGVQEE